MPESLVSVITPCYQQGHLLAGAIESVRGQTHGRWEMIVVDDGSTDETGRVAREAEGREGGRVRLIEQANQGQAAARARGLEEARGEVVVQLDADDRLEPGMMATLLGALERASDASDAAAAIGNAWLIDEGGRRIELFEQTAKRGYPGILEYNPHGALAGAMVRTAALRAIGGLGFPGVPGCEDWDVWVRLARCGMRIVTVGEPVAQYRQSAGGYSRQAEKMLRSTLDLLETCRSEDPRLAGVADSGGVVGAVGAVGAPITEAQYQRYRNSRVFHALGAVLAGGGAAAGGGDEDAAAVGAVLGWMVGGGFDREAALEQCRWGYVHVFRDRATCPALGEERIERATRAVTEAMEKAGLGGEAAGTAKGLRRILEKPERKDPIGRRIMRRLRG